MRKVRAKKENEYQIGRNEIAVWLQALARLRAGHRQRFQRAFR